VGHEDASDAVAPGSIRFADALRFWLRLGFISFGGPAGQIAIMYREVVEVRRWVSEPRFLHALNYCMLLPGPEAQQLATYLGWLMHGTRGGLAAGILFVLPSVFILLGLSIAYAAYGSLSAVAGVLLGFKSVVVAIIAVAALRIGRRFAADPAHLLVAVGAFSAIYFLHIPFPLIVLIAAAVGLLLQGSAWAPRPVPDGGARATLVQEDRPAASRARVALRTAMTGLVLWALPFGVLWGWLGWGSVLARQYRFFTGSALITFGGAYAVLAYVTQAAVDTFGWITPEQAVDGLALAETTPGPLIMVLQFVGFMTGWNHPEDLPPLAAATLGALLTTWTTFLPSIVFVLVGAPWVERLRGNRALHGALSGVAAATVGVILNLALVFGAAVIAPDGVTGGISWFAAAVTAAAFLAMRWWRIDALWIVLAGGLTGLTYLWMQG